MNMRFGSVLSGCAGLVMTVALAFGAPAWAQGPEGGGGGMWHAKGLMRMLDGVNTTPAQRQQIEWIVQILNPEIQALRQAHRDLMAKNMQLLLAPVIDEAALEQNRLQMLAQQDRITKRMSTAFIDMAKVLTAEQRAQLATRMQERMARHGAPGGERRRGHGAPAPAPAEPVR